MRLSKIQMMYNNWKMLSVNLSNTLSQKQLVLKVSNVVSLKEPSGFQQDGTDFEKAKENSRSESMMS